MDDSMNQNVLFYSKAMLFPGESEKEGRKIFHDVDFVRITIPGDSTNIIDTTVNELHKQRYPREWELYELRKKNGKVDSKEGTPLTELELAESQIKELEYLHIHSVETLANLSDAQMQRIGVGGLSIRNKAQKYMEENTGVLSELERLKAELAELKAAKKPGRPKAEAKAA